MCVEQLFSERHAQRTTSGGSSSVFSIYILTVDIAPKGDREKRKESLEHCVGI